MSSFLNFQVLCGLLSIFATLLSPVRGWFGLFTQEECYTEYGLGCYSNADPFNNANSLLPQSPASENAVEFRLFTKNNQQTYETLDPFLSSSVTTSTFDPLKDTKFLVHGYTSSGDADWIQDMKTDFLAEEDLNIIAVHWYEGARGTYLQAVANTRVVGDLIGLLIENMITCCQFDTSRVHLLGHSLGSHVSGYAGTFIFNRGYPKVARITGLDPAGPRFESFPAIVHLDPTDAVVVEAIHTDAASFWSSGSLGARALFGHIDFFPNGGNIQPGCPKSTSAFISNLLNRNAGYQLTCDHSRAYLLYLESIRSNCQFKAYPCASAADFNAGRCTTCSGGGCAYMGYKASKDAQPHGVFYMDTSDQSPFCLE